MASREARVIEAAPQAGVRDNDGLHRRRGIWEFRLKLDGKWRAFSTGTTNYNEARLFRQRKARELADGRAPSSMAGWTLAKALAAWRADPTRSISEATRKSERHLSPTLLRDFPARTLAEVTIEKVRAYQALRLRHVAPRTVNMEVGLLRQVLKQAKLWGRLRDDFKQIKEPTRGPGRALVPEQEAALFRAAASRPEWEVAYLCAIVAANTTCRGGEIKGLRLQDVDLFERTLNIRRSSTKTDAGCRVIPLNEASVWAFGKLRARAEALGASQPDHYLLPLSLYRHTKTGAPCAGTGYDPSRPTQGWRTAWRSLASAAGLGGLRFHDLRHHAITKLCEAGAPDSTIMSMAGHVSRQMLEHYSHIRLEAKRQAVAAICTGIPAQAEPQATQAVQ